MAAGPVEVLGQWRGWYNTDGVEFCPDAFGLHMLACSMYQLEGAERKGALAILDTAGAVKTEGATAPPAPLPPVAMMDTPGIFDMGWCPCAQPARAAGRLALACADGALRTVDVVPRGLAVDLAASWRCDLPKAGGSAPMCLAVAWSASPAAVAAAGAEHAAPGGSAAAALACSDSAGGLHTIDREGRLQASWKGHQLEVWVVAFDLHRSTTLYSGADDCLFKCWDHRDVSRPSFTSREHDMGVTSIAPNPFNAHLVATGSYDERLRIFDVRKPSAALQTVALGGGVWKLAWHPKEPTLLAACMHGGFKVVRPEPLEGKGGVVAAFREEDTASSVAYGATWCRGLGDVAATCTFYDNTVSVLRIPALHNRSGLL